MNDDTRGRQDRKLNEFARRSFRNVADRDYIASRMSFRATLWQQFLWLGLQAVEKYLKGVFLFNRISSKQVGHDLSKALRQANRLPFEMKLSDSAREMVGYLDRQAQYVRYLEFSYVIGGPQLLPALDRLVWEIRRYCQVIDEEVLAEIESSLDSPFHEFQIPGGVLETIVQDPEHPARSHLIWKNLYFGLRSRGKVSMRRRFYTENAPLFLNPEVLDKVLEYVHLPSSVVNAYRETQNRKELDPDGDE